MQLYDHFGDAYWLGLPTDPPPASWGASEEVGGWFAGELRLDGFEPGLMGASHGFGGIDPADERAMTDWIGAQLDRGRLRIWRRVRKIASSIRGTPPEAAAPMLSELLVVERTWIAWEVLDPHGKPLAGIAYELDTPDGEIRTGKTDAQGRVRESGIAKGTCAIRFTSNAA